MKNLGFSNFLLITFQTDIFAGTDLKECYNFEMGSIANATDFGKNNCKQTAAKNVEIAMIFLSFRFYVKSKSAI